MTHAPDARPTLDAGDEPVLASVRWADVVGEALSEDELERASRLSKPDVRARFVAARTFLRRTLGRALDLPPLDVQLGEGPHGKPHVVDSSLAFNVSHAGAWVVVALSLRGAVGVDVEDVTLPVDVLELAPTIATPRERAWLEAGASDEARRRRFFELWTMKEAALKTWGVGLTLDPRELEIDVTGTSELQRAFHPAHGATLLRPFACDLRHIGCVSRRINET